MEILITGSNGFIGKNLYDYYKYDKTNNYIFGTTSQLNGFVKFNNYYNNMEEILVNAKIDCIIHLAAVIPSSFESADFNDVFLSNANIMNNMYEFSIKNGIKKFIYISGFGSMEDYRNYKIKDYYTLSKIHGEHVCAMMENKGIETASLRISAPYGKGSNKKSVINTFINNSLNGLDINIYGTGKREQNFIYVDDIIHAIELFVTTNNKINGVYSIIADKNTSMLNLAEIIKSICNSKSKIKIGKYDDIQESFKPSYDYDRAYREVGFKPKYNIYDGLKKYIELYVDGI
ncbi:MULTISPECIES: NAD(P)-dependent oxidoreductase [unclassified Clostridium]|uniref:NAD-dependent epimerase/dehydratase family protein n=1 Tax=unclassified Clostridium TaxID=2614128 RepID=UPI001EEAFC7E|nr:MULTISPECIES: NAD(P)-dependent oxidoreductase [unclassified Clostridium]